MLNTPYPELNRVLRELTGSEMRILGDDFIGAYLQGSFATGGFDEHSDCDFIIVSDRELNGEELLRLQSGHKSIFNMGLE